MANSKLVSFELSHFYPIIELQKFWEFFVDHKWYSQSEIMAGEIVVLKEGKDHPQGLGAVRKILIGDINLTEDIVGFDPPNYFSYAVHEGGMPVNKYRGEFFYESKNGGMLWKYKGNFEPKHFGTGWFFKWFLKSRMKSQLPVWENGYNSYYKTSTSL
ncbi:hypothetical protein G5B37_00175 [Rasiella rasia]|uniref:Uncharacterized protein n=1 Tax=Rasiella rasia TaxID=2744027 RepID=A0A6G6GHP4_9FLAO|nr:hypothetical protein [Rasiella rasia]QIE58037.1 hypothetical protein G5B37_00175 [Rasiella rasia]